MNVKCPRCENEFEIDELVYGNDVKCQKCGLFIGTEYDEDYDEEYGESYYEWSNDTPADCCKDCKNLNLQSCIGVCKVDICADRP